VHVHAHALEQAHALSLVLTQALTHSLEQAQAQALVLTL
jgi:hypothetical protein